MSNSVFTAHKRMTIAVKAEVGEQTVRRFLAGRAVRPAVANAIRSAMAELGIAIPAPSPTPAPKDAAR